MKKIRSTSAARIAVFCLVLQSTLLVGQDRSYSFDKAGNLKSIGAVNTSSDPLNCGSVGTQCDGGKGTCAAGKCVPPPCTGASCGTTVGRAPSPVTVSCMAAHCGVPVQPVLVSGGLRGHRVCGDFAGDGMSFTFDCQPLASSVDSGWLLTPLFWVGSDGKSNPNKAVVLTVTTPTRTELFVEWQTQAGNRIAQQQVTRQPGDAEVKNVGTNGQVAEVMTDDGFTRTWTLQFLVGTCMDVAQINIYNVGSSGSTNGVMSAPLRVWFLRDPQESVNVTSCV